MGGGVKKRLDLMTCGEFKMWVYIKLNLFHTKIKIFCYEKFLK